MYDVHTQHRQGPKKLSYKVIVLLSEVSGILELGNVWVFVQLIFGPHWPMNQLNKNPNIA